tara:strand:- start:368 stop:520 length:153 start_codon:yes stop_codon:yes gene_type:complete
LVALISLSGFYEISASASQGLLRWLLDLLEMDLNCIFDVSGFDQLPCVAK